MRSLQLAGMPVIHIDLGCQLGTVHGVLLDPQARRVTALLVRIPQGWGRKGLLRIEDVYAIGDRAVTVQDQANLVLPDQDESLWSRWRERVDLHGMPILTEDGHGLGTVAAFDFELDGRITGLAVRQGVWQRLTQPPWIIPGIYLRAFGPHAVIVEAQALEELRKAQEAEQQERRRSRSPAETPISGVASTPASPPSGLEGEAQEQAADGLLARLRRRLSSRVAPAGEPGVESPPDPNPPFSASSEAPGALQESDPAGQDPNGR